MSGEVKFSLENAFQLSKTCCLHGGFINGAAAKFNINLRNSGDNYVPFVPDLMIVKQITYPVDTTGAGAVYSVYCPNLNSYLGSFGIGQVVGGQFSPPSSIALDIPINCKGADINVLDIEVKTISGGAWTTATDLSEPLHIIVQFIKLVEKKTLAEGSTATHSGIGDSAKSKKI